MPPVDAQFFYSSLIPIDDPLSAVGCYDSKSSRRQLRPFDRGDNCALDRAWLALGSDTDRRRHHQARTDRGRMSCVASGAADFEARLVQKLAQAHREKHRSKPPSSQSSAPCCSQLVVDVSEELRNGFCGLARKRLVELSLDNVVQAVVAAMNSMRKPAEHSTETYRGVPRTVSPNRPRADFVACPLSRGPMPQIKLPADGAKENDRPSLSARDVPGTLRNSHHDLQPPNSSFSSSNPTTVRNPACATDSDGGISGTSSVRVGSLGAPTPSAPLSFQHAESSSAVKSLAENHGHEAALGDFGDQRPISMNPTNGGRQSMEIVVGVSRLHKVSLPMLQMKPIYWSPISDVALVLRATWFYRLVQSAGQGLAAANHCPGTLIPVAPVVANQLEAGYQELRPWTQTWSDEIRCALEVGPLGEEKVSHCLWPEHVDQLSGVNGGDPEPTIS